MKAKFKVTARTTKDQLLEVLKANANTEGVDQPMKDTISYVVGNPKKAKRDELHDLVNDLMKTLGSKLIIPVFAEGNPNPEDLVKKNQKSKDSKNTDADDDAGDKPKKPVVTPRKTLMADAFPETIEVGGETFKIDHSVKTLADLRSDENADAEFEFAFYWTARHLKQFRYRCSPAVQVPKSFNNDLDTAQLIYVSEEDAVAYAVSDVTEALYSLYPDDMTEVEGLRYCNGIEFQIYRKVDTENEGEAE